MTQWLLAAEADRIQDYIFRSSRLAQVVGGSGLLSRFCAEVPQGILSRCKKDFPGVTYEIIISDGGSFLILFEDAPGVPQSGKEMAERVGRDLSEAYYRGVDNSLTVAEPESYGQSDEFQLANKAANVNLRMKKTDHGEAVTTAAHLPYTAICESCGISLANAYAKPSENANEESMLLCSSCQRKGMERKLFKTQPERERFLSQFREALRSTEAWEQLPDDIRQALSVTERGKFSDFLPYDAEDVGGYDPRNYVAYIVADGNNMGVLFSQCESPEQMHALSKALTQVMWQAVAETTMKLVGNLWNVNDKRCPIPVTPLIVGGDDLFALVPAPYALSFARETCLQFEKGISRFLEDAASRQGWKYNFSAPTMSAAVIICKQNYPYALAHRKGEAILGKTKELSRAASLRDAVKLSAVNFEIVRGGDIEAGSYEDREYLLPTLRPYWVAKNTLSRTAERYSRSLRTLLEARFALKALPGKRRAELRQLFLEQLPIEEETVGHTPYQTVLQSLQENGSWRQQFDKLLQLVSRHPSDIGALTQVLAWLGANTPYPWLKLESRSEYLRAHGLPDLVEFWHFSQDLQYTLDEYEV